MQRVQHFQFRLIFFHRIHILSHHFFRSTGAGMNTSPVIVWLPLYLAFHRSNLCVAIYYLLILSCLLAHPQPPQTSHCFPSSVLKPKTNPVRSWKLACSISALLARRMLTATIKAAPSPPPPPPPPTFTVPPPPHLKVSD